MLIVTGNEVIAMAELATVAFTETDSLVLPALSTVVATPLALVFDELNESVAPLLDVIEKSTVASLTVEPEVSFTVNDSVLVSGMFEVPAPLMAMVLGEAEVNSIDPTVWLAILMVPVAAVPSERVAVMVSVPVQPNVV